ncbi:DUF4156 domain-containing protein [Legionella jamestowniensis]|uniref:Cytochrome c type biogenesis protein CycH n=1 Tax=Legionella jamestowniensis TaxID=455 RepID=A0A0W0UPM2_9GAMM|nr:DUF4156 domain-containing protein [Legionella jamestowniensis]KTD09417.1 cytochrome c type biogenesis protein CycH [Legionella jamestowniensis]OCH99243.1 hypothetical protein A8135_08340 [Legionella jamestowniensis]SFL88936.1 protein of unknown function [Legionella jamestowniensis DSM 19215]
MKKILSVSAIALVLGGCASIPADPQAERIVASPNPAPKGCKYIGQVVGNQGNFFTGGFTSNRNLEEGAMNDLKNRASRKGANYVQVVTNRAGVTGSMSGSFDNQGGFMSGSSQQTNVTYLGNAYRCDPKAIGLVD